MTFAAALDGARDRIAHRERVRTIRMQRHLAVAALVAVVGCVMGPAVHSFFGLMALAAGVGVILGSLARAADARLGKWWGWLYGEPTHSTRLDLLVDGYLRRLISVVIGQTSAVGSATDTADNEPKIRILPLGRDPR